MGKELRGLDLCRYRYVFCEAGINATRNAEQLHFHKLAQQFFYILYGEATFRVEGEIVVVKSNQGILIKPGLQHRISNVNETDLSFILTSQPSTRNDRFNCNENE